MNRWFYSDPHFNHPAIIELCHRPYLNYKCMVKDIIHNINSLVEEDDELYCIGDFALARSWEYNIIERIFDKINAKYQHLILGNHDNLKPFDYVRMGFISVHTALELTLKNDEKVILVHDPAISTIDRNRIFLCGHLHDLFSTKYNVINLSVEVCNYKPLSEDQIIEIIKEMRNGKI